MFLDIVLYRVVKTMRYAQKSSSAMSVKLRDLEASKLCLIDQSKKCFSCFCRIKLQKYIFSQNKEIGFLGYFLCFTTLYYVNFYHIDLHLQICKHIVFTCKAKISLSSITALLVSQQQLLFKKSDRHSLNMFQTSIT